MANTLPNYEKDKVSSFNYLYFLSHLNLESAHHRAFLSAVFARLAEKDPQAFSKGSDLHTLFVAAVESKAPS
jgi:hypothetical protein